MEELEETNDVIIWSICNKGINSGKKRKQSHSNKQRVKINGSKLFLLRGFDETKRYHNGNLIQCPDRTYNYIFTHLT